MFCKKRCSKKFCKTCLSLLFNKVTGLRPATLLKKRLWPKCFPVNFVIFLRITFLQNSSRRLLFKTVKTLRHSQSPRYPEDICTIHDAWRVSPFRAHCCRLALFFTKNPKNISIAYIHSWNKNNNCEVKVSSFVIKSLRFNVSLKHTFNWKMVKENSRQES